MFVILSCGASKKEVHAFVSFEKVRSGLKSVSVGCVGFHFIFPAMLCWSSGHVVLQLIHSNSITYLFSVISRKFPHRFSLFAFCFQIQILFVFSWSIDSWGSIYYYILMFTFALSYMVNMNWFSHMVFLGDLQWHLTLRHLLCNKINSNMNHTQRHAVNVTKILHGIMCSSLFLWQMVFQGKPACYELH